jgi:hypothetical protein
LDTSTREQNCAFCGGVPEKKFQKKENMWKAELVPKQIHVGIRGVEDMNDNYEYVSVARQGNP